MRRIRALQKILAMQSEMIIWFIPFCSFCKMTATAQMLRKNVMMKMGRAKQRQRVSGT